MTDVCYCSRTGEIADGEPILVEGGRLALRYPSEACGHADRLEWLPEEEAGLLLWGEARRRRERLPDQRDAA